MPYPAKLVSVQNPKSLVGLWIFAILWCGISFTVFGAFAFGARDLVGGAIGGLFSLIGLAMLYGAIAGTLEYWKYGKVHLALARPAETGGKLEARLELPATMPASARVSAELACVQVVWSRGSKGSRSKREQDDWTRKETFVIRRGASGCEALLVMDIPADRPSSTLPGEGAGDSMFESTHPGAGVELDQSYYRWELRIAADVPGVDLARTFRLAIAEGRATTYSPPAPVAAPVLDPALERRLDAERSVERRLAMASFIVGVTPFVVPFAILGLAVGLAGCPMGWSAAEPPSCEFAGMDWGPLMAGTFDLMPVAVPAGIFASTVLYLAGQAWLKSSSRNRPPR